MPDTPILTKNTGISIGLVLAIMVGVGAGVQTHFQTGANAKALTEYKTADAEKLRLARAELVREITKVAEDVGDLESDVRVLDQRNVRGMVSQENQNVINARLAAQQQAVLDAIDELKEATIQQQVIQAQQQFIIDELLRQGREADAARDAE